MLHNPQLTLYSTAVVTIAGIASGHHESSSKDGSQSKRRDLNVLHNPRLILHSTAVSSKESMAISHHRSINKDGSKSK